MENIVEFQNVKEGINLVVKFAPYVDEAFSSQSKISLLTNQEYSWDGAHTVCVYKVGTAGMVDYDRPGTGGTLNRFGAVNDLDAGIELMVLQKDRAFSFCIDKLDTDETGQVLQAGGALARQIREVVIPEVDSFVYKIMCKDAGYQPEPIILSESNIYDEIIRANEALDNAEVPETERVVIVDPTTYVLLKKSADIMMHTDIAEDMRLRGVVGMIDGCQVVKVPKNRLPEGFGFMVAHPCATVAPVKLEDYRVHQDPPGLSGALVEGRTAYGCFVLSNKARGVYYQAQPDLSLSALTIGSLTLSPVFDSDKLEYTASTTDATNTITATAKDASATVTIKNSSTLIESGSAATWSDGANVVTITVRGGSREKIYTVTVTKS